MKPFTSKHCTPISYGSPLKQDKTITGENTGIIKVDKEGRPYSLIMENSVNARKGDTIRPQGGLFHPNKIVDGYLMGGDYPVTKTGDKTLTIDTLKK